MSGEGRTCIAYAAQRVSAALMIAGCCDVELGLCWIEVVDSNNEMCRGCCGLVSS